MTSRRRFLATLAGLFAGAQATLAGVIPAPASTPSPMPAVLTDPQVGISIRFVQQYDVHRAWWDDRRDVYYGYALAGPPLACRIEA